MKRQPYGQSAAIDLAVRAPRSDEEMHLANELIHRAWEAEGRDDRWRMDWGRGYPGFAQDHARLAFWRGELAGALRIHSETIRIGEARLKAGGLGWLTTENRFREKGVARGLLLDALAFLREQRYHVAMLFGKPHVHYPWGFHTCLPDYAVVVETRIAMRQESPYRVRRAGSGDLRVLQRMHSDNDAATSCSILRMSGHFANKAKEFTTFHAIADREGRVAGYFFAQDCGTYLEVEEVGVADAAVCPAVLRHCGELAAETSLGTIRFRVPPSHLFARYMLEQPSLHEVEVLQDGGGMLAFIDIPETLESMIPEWEGRVAESLVRDIRTECTLVVEGQAIRIRANRGALDVAATQGTGRLSLSTRELMVMLTGHRSAADILEGRFGLLGGEARLLLQALFPKRTPYVWPFDRF